MRGFMLLILGVLLGLSGGVFASQIEPSKSFVQDKLAPFLPKAPIVEPEQLLPLAIGETHLSAEALAPFGIEPCFPRQEMTELSERPWLDREVDAAGLVDLDDLPPSPDLSRYPGLIKIEGMRSMLGTEREHCAAVRIAEHWFLTAAHCIVDLDIRTARPTYDVIAITPSADVRGADTQVVPLTGALCHGAYGMNRQQYPNDIGLFYLNDVTAFESVEIASLETADLSLIPADFRETYIAAWGKNGGTRYLQGGPVTMAEIGEAVITADKVGVKGPNVGDSGAPLYLETPDGPVVIGTLSQVTQDENEDGDTSIYVRTKSVHDWIQRTIAICEQDGVYTCLQPEVSTSLVNNP